MNALDAIAWYLRFQKDPHAWRDHLRAVVDYNEDDCMATKFVKDWLSARTGSANAAAQVRVPDGTKIPGTGCRVFRYLRKK